MAHVLSRRHTLLLGASTGLALASLSDRPLFAAQAAQDIKDEDIFQFALNLEYMEAEYYLRGTRGKGLDAGDIGADPGKVIGGDKVSFKTRRSRSSLKRWPRMDLPTFASIGKHLAEVPSIVRLSTSMQDFPLQLNGPASDQVSMRSRTR